MKIYICPACGDDMRNWNQGIYECDSCSAMMDEDDLIEIYGKDGDI